MAADFFGAGSALFGAGSGLFAARAALFGAVSALFATGSGVLLSALFGGDRSGLGETALRSGAASSGSRSAVNETKPGNTPTEAR